METTGIARRLAAIGGDRPQVAAALSQCTGLGEPVPVVRVGEPNAARGGATRASIEVLLAACDADGGPGQRGRPRH